MAKSQYRFFQTLDGVRLRYRHWPCKSDPCRGTVVLLSGRAEFMEKYRETIQEINDRRFDTFSFDWRGQGGSQRLLADTTKGHVQRYDHYVNDLKQIFEEMRGLNCPKPWYLMAHSMGAHVAMQYLGQHADAVAGAILLSPLVDIDMAPLSRTVLKWLSRSMVRMGQEALVLPGARHNGAVSYSFKGNRLTSDPVRFQRVQQLLQKHARLAIGNATFGWLAATFDAIEKLNSPEYAQQIGAPLLLVLAGNDRIVSNRATLRLAKKLPNKEIAIIQEARHEILQEGNRIRSQFWQAFDAFVNSGC